MLSVNWGSRPVIVLLAAGLLTGCGPSEAEKAVRERMLDPEATQFKDVKPCPADKEMTVGNFNGKNLMGAFTGFKPFFYKKYQTVLLGDPGFEQMLKDCYGDLIRDEMAGRPLTDAGNSNGN